MRIWPSPTWALTTTAGVPLPRVSTVLMLRPPGPLLELEVSELPLLRPLGTHWPTSPAPTELRTSTVRPAGPDVDTAVALVREHRPAVVLLDVHLPGGNGHGGVDVLHGCRGLETSDGRPVRFLALSVSDAAEDVIAVIRAGARGYVTKTIGAADLTRAIHRVADGDAVFSPRLAGFVLDAFGAAAGELAEVDEELDRLSAREREVMRLIARGYQYKEVAKELFISVKTVETHVSSVLRKLQLSSRHELTAWAMGRRLM